jgi:hypothetical protein
MRSHTGYVSCIALLGLAVAGPVRAADRAVTFFQASEKVEAYDFVEVSINVKGSLPKNPFTDVAIPGQFGLEGSNPISVLGFCDATDGSTYRIRFMPGKSGVVA